MANFNVLESGLQVIPVGEDVLPLARGSASGTERYKGVEVGKLADMIVNGAIGIGQSAPGDSDKVAGRRKLYIQSGTPAMLFWHSGVSTAAWVAVGAGNTDNLLERVIALETISSGLASRLQGAESVINSSRLRITGAEHSINNINRNIEELTQAVGRDSTFIYGINGLVDSEKVIHTPEAFIGFVPEPANKFRAVNVPFDIGQAPLRAIGTYPRPITFTATAVNADVLLPVYTAPAGKGIYFTLEEGVYTMQFTCSTNLSSTNGITIFLMKVLEGLDDNLLQAATGGYETAPLPSASGINITGRGAINARIIFPIFPVTQNDIFYLLLASRNLVSSVSKFSGSLTITKHRT